MRRQSKIAWSIAGVAVLMAAAATFAVAALAPLKSVEPFIVRVDSNTGYTDVISTLKHQTVENDEVMNNYWLGKYVEYREGYRSVHRAGYLRCHHVAERTAGAGSGATGCSIASMRRIRC